MTMTYDCQFEDQWLLEIMESVIHKNEQGNWEMPSPLCLSKVFMPNNQSYTIKCLDF